EFTQFARTYVPVARLWFGPVLVVVLTDPDAIGKVVKHDKVGGRGYLFTKLMSPAFRNGLLVIDGDKWRAHRKIVSSALNTNVLETFVENFAKNSDILANKLKALADGNTAHDIVPYFTRCSLDIICQTSLHIDINAQEGKDNDTLNAITTIIETVAVFKEAMRLFPPVPIHSREAIKEIDLGHGHIVPAGAITWMPAYVIHKDPKHFPEPEKFDPDRFSPQNSVGRHPYAYTPFGIGRRMCVGHEYATMEAKTILSTVLRRYCVTEIEGGIRGLEKTLKFTFVLSNANGIRVKLLPRSHPS
ncbi:hypothetical protein Cfor_04564, partial [Coptotermes formosanus]